MRTTTKKIESYIKPPPEQVMSCQVCGENDEYLLISHSMRSSHWLCSSCYQHLESGKRKFNG